MTEETTTQQAATDGQVQDQVQHLVAHNPLEGTVIEEWMIPVIHNLLTGHLRKNYYLKSTLKHNHIYLESYNKEDVKHFIDFTRYNDVHIHEVDTSSYGSASTMQQVTIEEYELPALIAQMLEWLFSIHAIRSEYDIPMGYKLPTDKPGYEPPAPADEPIPPPTPADDGLGDLEDHPF